MSDMLAVNERCFIQTWTFLFLSIVLVLDCGHIREHILGILLPLQACYYGLTKGFWRHFPNANSHTPLNELIVLIHVPLIVCQICVIIEARADVPEPFTQLDLPCTVSVITLSNLYMILTLSHIR